MEKLTPTLRQPTRGDIIVFTAPTTSSLMVKRVVALQGDTVGLADGRLVVSRHWVPEDYVDLASVDGVYFGPDVVPVGSVFVMGEARADSIDSRTFGAVPDDRSRGSTILPHWAAARQRWARPYRQWDWGIT